MIHIRRSAERGHSKIGWLDSWHTFSFSDYYDPQHMGFRDLRVINEDKVDPGQGFATHGHRDMEIISYVLEGELQHRDNMGTGSVIRPGDVQRMSAGKGVLHSEYNPSPSEKVHFLQVWIRPARTGTQPSYAQKRFEDFEKRDRLRLIVSPEGEEGSIDIGQDARLYAGLLGKGARVQHELRPGRHAWVQVARGRVELNGERLEAGDGAAVSDETKLELRGASVGAAEVLVFDLK